MATLDELIDLARRAGASDAHIEPGMPLTLRVRGRLQMVGTPLPARQVMLMAKNAIGEQHWDEFLSRCSHDASILLQGVRCRVNAMQTSRGIGLAIRLLSSFHATLEKLNLHPSLGHLIHHQHGLVLVCGPTGSGKSTTIAALLEEINQTEARHMITIEQPIEYTFRPNRSLIRQREVGRDTPSFAQALIDAMREDPDVLVVGEMRHAETMRLTLNAAETGHLVISTLHSSTCAEALQRVVSAFPAESQSNVCSQLAECLVGVVCQRLGYRADLDLRVPECEILIATTGIRALIRQGHFSRLANAIETGGEHGMWSLQRYQRWLEQRSDWHMGTEEPELQREALLESPLLSMEEDTDTSIRQRPISQPQTQAWVPAAPGPTPVRAKRFSSKTRIQRDAQVEPGHDQGVFVLEPQEDDLEALVAAFKKKS